MLWTTIKGSVVGYIDGVGCSCSITNMEINGPVRLAEFWLKNTVLAELL